MLTVMVSNKLSSRQRYLLCLLSGYTKAIPLYCSVCMVVRMWQQVATPSEMLCQAFHVLCIAAHCGEDAVLDRLATLIKVLTTSTPTDILFSCVFSLYSRFLTLSV